MAKSANRRWTNLRTSASGRTIADDRANRKKPSGKKIETEKPRKRTEAAPLKWWKTVLVRGGTCDSCSTVLDPDAQVAYTHELKRKICRSCAEREGVWEIAAESKKYRAWREQRGRGPTDLGKAIKKTHDKLVRQVECPQCMAQPFMECKGMGDANHSERERAFKNAPGWMKTTWAPEDYYAIEAAMQKQAT